MLAIVLAAGRGQRLRPLTDRRSKAMLPIAGKPMIERVMDMLARGGADRFVAVVHADDRPLVEHLSQSARAAQIRLAYQEQRLGMAHAVECAVPLIQDDGGPDFVLASCDNLYPEGHVAALVARKRTGEWDAALTLLPVQPEQMTMLAVVALQNDRITGIVEKPRPEQAPSNLGVPALYALSTRVLDYLPRVPVSPRGEREFPDALRLLLEDGGLIGGLPVTWRMTLTSPADLLPLNRHFLRHDPACATVEADVPGDVTITPPVRVEPGVELGAGCCVGPEVYLESGCRVGAGSTLRRAVVLRGATVETGTVLEERVIG